MRFSQLGDAVCRGHGGYDDLVGVENFVESDPVRVHRKSSGLFVASVEVIFGDQSADKVAAVLVVVAEGGLCGPGKVSVPVAEMTTFLATPHPA